MDKEILLACRDAGLGYEGKAIWEHLDFQVRRGDYICIVGENGSGKSTLREELVERLRLNGESVIVVEPYTLSMAESEKNGKPLRAPHIAEAISYRSLDRGTWGTGLWCTERTHFKNKYYETDPETDSLLRGAAVGSLGIRPRADV